ncbi:hypothetical protein K1T73_10275 [Roseovarius sp. SCSIO 43702]|uniref:hypothetical protein n=1 Tax=Roseovarius sp. SCSIO 43702 TaxID=2823043 RepID=UPI001C73A983|nr:hypothetical protein [Roseovarius sp. SCSIO 43702]QYX55492.1 hypothetical protein K1T73_10275 [Roseovarius sp. SCSIO 43702]
MPKPLFLLALVLGLGSCAPLTVWHKPGGAVAEMERALTACEVTALRQVPRDIRRRYTPPTRAPYTACDGTGHCWTTWRVVSPGRWESWDANEGLRSRVARQCMMDKGYRRVEVPACDPEITRATDLAVTRVMPPLTSQSCAIRFKTGRWQIVTPE